MSMLRIEVCTFRGMCREFFVLLASQTSLGLMYDNPNKVQEVENIIADFYSGMRRGFIQTRPGNHEMRFSTCTQFLPRQDSVVRCRGAYSAEITFGGRVGLMRLD